MWSPSKINCNRVIYRIPSGGYDEIGTSYIIEYIHVGVAKIMNALTQKW
jgi:hypothetical protein